MPDLRSSLFVGDKGKNQQGFPWSISKMIAGSEISTLESQNPLLEDDDEAHGFADYKGCPTQRSRSGGWRSGAFILGAGALERFAYFGIESNIINYFTGHLGESTVAAAAIVNTWTGLNWLMPIFGASVADSFLGSFPTVILSSILYTLGVGSLTLLAFLVANSQATSISTLPSGSHKKFRTSILLSLYVVSVAQGYKPCVQAFGADQFDDKNAAEKKAKKSFFNWWFCGVSAGGAVSHLILHYIQDYVTWVLGFGIPCLSLILGLVLFLLGTPTYRFGVRKSHVKSREDSSSCEVDGNAMKYVGTVAERAHGTSSIISYQGSGNTKEHLQEAESSKGYAASGESLKINKYEVLKLISIWATFLTYGIAYAQASTFFTKQGTTMDKSIGQNLVLPAASLKTFIPLTAVIFIPIYDILFIPLARRITRKPSGITVVHRIGIGMALCVITMGTAALTETKRLEVAKEHDLVNIPNATVPMSIWWLVPQYVLLGVADVFALVGMQEFFYDQVPTRMRSSGLSLYFSAIGVGNFCSSFIILVIHEATGENGRGGWLDNNLNHAHLDYFYWLLAGIVCMGLIAFAVFARAHNLGRHR